MPDVDDANDGDLDLSSFQIVADFWPDDQSSEEEEPEPAADMQTDNWPWVDHNINDVDVINMNVNTDPSTSDNDVPTGGPLDNEAVMNAPAELLNENEQGARSTDLWGGERGPRLGPRAKGDLPKGRYWLLLPIFSLYSSQREC